MVAVTGGDKLSGGGEIHRYDSEMTSNHTWTLTVGGTAYVIDWKLGTHIVNAASTSQGHGSTPFTIPGVAEPVEIVFGRDDHWSIVKNG